LPILCDLYIEYMVKELFENMLGHVNGQNVNNLRYSDDAVFVTDEEKK